MGQVLSHYSVPHTVYNISLFFRQQIKRNRVILSLESIKQIARLKTGAFLLMCDRPFGKKFCDTVNREVTVSCSDRPSLIACPGSDRCTAGLPLGAVSFKIQSAQVW